MAGKNEKGKSGFQVQYPLEKVTEVVHGLMDEISGMTEDADKRGQQKIRALLTDYELMKRIGCCHRTLTSMMVGEGNYEPYAKVMEDFVAFRERICIEFLDTTAWIFLSKQKRYGGLQDVQKSESKSTSKIEITLAGSDGKPLSLK